MDRSLVALKPALVWKHFAEIVRIPRPSSHEEKIRRYILDFARAQGLESKEDAAHNVYVRKPASKGMEDRKGVILQAHLDMVPQKNNDKEFDFTKDPIDAYIDGGRETAAGTTKASAGAAQPRLPRGRLIAAITSWVVTCSQCDPASAPVHSYHCTSRTSCAKALPRTSQGNEISPLINNVS